MRGEVRRAGVWGGGGAQAAFRAEDRPSYLGKRVVYCNTQSPRNGEDQSWSPTRASLRAMPRRGRSCQLASSMQCLQTWAKGGPGP